MWDWDPLKAADNLKKHWVSFDEASTVFLDPFALSFDDPDHSTQERRFITIGTSQRNRILFVSHADGSDEQVRIISARAATTREAHEYQESRRPRR